ncbi:MAG: LacI family DNA-binding transcriptional regulator [Pontiellaceae bacterium]|nr:LacI family DNA-binding transcriptional regulator [Pontiellaceae bacterium]MBN2783612.1 LacI family DNA-binding transcriptional regulator [Pontiellaceae bacterium]
MHSQKKEQEFRAGVVRVTQQDIAEEVGLSAVSVSLALRNSPRISAATRERVQKMAKEMGYSPDPMLQSLSSYRRQSARKPVDSVIAWIDSASECEEFSGCFDGASSAAQLAGYRIDRFDSSGMRPVRLAQILETRGISGIILSPTCGLDTTKFPLENFTAVRIGGPALNVDLHRVSPAHTANVFKAFEKMRERGYERIGYVASKNSPWGSVSHYFCRFQEQLTGGEYPLLVLGEDQSGEEQCRMFDGWIESNRLDAVLTDMPQVRNCLEKAGYRIPDDIGYASTAASDPVDSAGINPRLNEVGRVAFSTVSGMLSRQEQGLPEIPFSILIDGLWKDGKTLRPVAELSCSPLAV